MKKREGPDRNVVPSSATDYAVEGNAVDKCTCDMCRAGAPDTMCLQAVPTRGDMMSVLHEILKRLSPNEPPNTEMPDSWFRMNDRLRQDAKQTEIMGMLVNIFTLETEILDRLDKTDQKHL